MNTTYFLNLVAGNIFGSKKLPAIPSTYYVGLSTTEPNLSGGNVGEPRADAGYSRVLVTNLSEPVNGIVSNNGAIEFPESTGSWGVITHVLLYDAETGGNLLMYDNLDVARTVEIDTSMIIKSNALKLSVINPVV